MQNLISQYLISHPTFISLHAIYKTGRGRGRGRGGRGQGRGGRGGDIGDYNGPILKLQNPMRLQRIPVDMPEREGRGEGRE